VHANAPMTPTGRRLVCERIEAGRPTAHVADEMGISRQTVSKWWNRYLAEGEVGLVDRRSTPRSCPGRLPQRTYNPGGPGPTPFPNWFPSWLFVVASTMLGKPGKPILDALLTRRYKRDHAPPPGSLQRYGDTVRLLASER
jgi:hypothetical protein